eukprot:g20192.t1
MLSEAKDWRHEKQFHETYGPYTFENYKKMQMAEYLSGLEPFTVEELDAMVCDLGPGCRGPEALLAVARALGLEPKERRQKRRFTRQHGMLVVLFLVRSAWLTWRVSTASDPPPVDAATAERFAENGPGARALHRSVQQVQPELAPKLTGMLLQLGEAECWACLEDHNKLAERLDEAMAILDGAHAEAAPKAKPQPEKRPSTSATSRTTATAPAAAPAAAAVNGTHKPKAAARPAPAAPAAPAAAKVQPAPAPAAAPKVQPAPAKAPKGSQVPAPAAAKADLKMKSLERKRIVENGEAAAQAVEEMEEEGADEDEDALEEGRAGQLDTERDLAALSYVDHPEPDLPPARPAAARPCAATAAPSAARAPATSTARPAAVATAPARSGRKQGFGGDEESATGGYYDKGAEESQPFSMGQRAVAKRVDLEDGKAKTFRELQAEYTHLSSTFGCWWISSMWRRVPRVSPSIVFRILLASGVPLRVSCNGWSPPDDLLYVLNCSEVDLPQFLALTSSDQVIHLFRKHVMHMDTVTKTRLVDALQRQHDFYANRLQQELVVELLESTTGDELRMMKDILDEGGDFYNLHKLVFHDLDPEMHSRVLSHIQQQGRRLAKQYDPGQAPMKIVSDVDDTLYGSGGHFPAGCDERFPRHQASIRCSPFDLGW